MDLPRRRIRIIVLYYRVRAVGVDGGSDVQIEIFLVSDFDFRRSVLNNDIQQITGAFNIMAFARNVFAFRLPFLAVGA